MIINRVAIYNQGVELEFDAPEAQRIIITIKRTDTGAEAGEASLPKSRGGMRFSGLLNGVLYEASAIAYDICGNKTGEGRRLFMPNFIPGRCVSYLHPYDTAFDPAGRFFGSPSIVKTDSGVLYASHDLFLEDFPNCYDVDFRDVPAKDRCRTKLYRSLDGGRGWEYIADIPNCMFGELFTLNGGLYLLGQGSDPLMPVRDPSNVDERRSLSGEQCNIRIQLFQSTDGGFTWSQPCVITHGHPAGSFHKAPTPVLIHEGRLWMAFDTPKDPETGFGAAAASAPLDADIMNPESWVVTFPFLQYDRAWPDTLKRVWPYMMEEANIAAAPDGSLKVISRYNSVNYGDEFINPSDDALRVVIMNADKTRPEAPLTFERMQRFIGSLSKFSIRRDEVTGRYFSLVSRVTEKHCCQRNILTLVSSADLYNWRIERDLINLEDMEWYQDCEHCGMHYCAWVFDGDDILAVCRTALHDCRNFHDSNQMTFHRFRNFRELNYAFRFQGD